MIDMTIRGLFTKKEKDSEVVKYTKALFSLGTTLTLLIILTFALVGRMILHHEQLLTFPFDYAEFVLLPILGVFVLYTYLTAVEIYEKLSDETKFVRVHGA